MPLISVVVPVYNVEEYLSACLESIGRQTEGDLEVLVVNDGSTDRSGEIAAEFAGRDQRFRVITKENGGLSSARNAGAEAATGEFLIFVDSDQKPVKIAEVGRVTFSEGVRMASQIFAKRKVDKQEGSEP